MTVAEKFGGAVDAAQLLSFVVLVLVGPFLWMYQLAVSESYFVLTVVAVSWLASVIVVGLEAYRRCLTATSLAILLAWTVALAYAWSSSRDSGYEMPIPRAAKVIEPPPENWFPIASTRQRGSLHASLETTVAKSHSHLDENWDSAFAWSEHHRQAQGGDERTGILAGGLGARDVKTYRVSGNAVFRHRLKNATKLADRISDGVEKAFGFEPCVMMLESVRRTSERFALLDDVFYFYASEGFHKAKLGGKLERALGVGKAGTGRTLGTLVKVMSIASELDSKG